MKIKIQREKAIKREKIKRASWVVIGTLIWSLSIMSILWISNSFDEPFFRFGLFFYSFIFMALWELVFYQLFLIKIYTLEYSIDEEENKLISKWRVILKHKEIARLQVVNSVDIDQDIWDKFVDLHQVSVSYGFSESGYNHYFRYVTEDEAEKIAGKIKPSGRLGVDLK